MSDKSDLKAELERKKQRLAQIREEKKRKEEERKKKEADMQQKKEPVQDDSDLDRKRRETEALLQSIGISPEPPLVSTPSEAGSQDSGDLGPLTRLSFWKYNQSRNNSVLMVLAAHWCTAFQKHYTDFKCHQRCMRRLHRLGVSKVTQVDFLPREVVSYSKETQTPLATHQSEAWQNLRLGSANCPLATDALLTLGGPRSPRCLADKGARCLPFPGCVEAAGGGRTGGRSRQSAAGICHVAGLGWLRIWGLSHGNVLTTTAAIQRRETMNYWIL
ncbi:hypothetical protein PANDA_007533 [Ailuropoda melanoleuca]|uniref:Dynein cytoplasmic 1 intermediate chain 1 n=1 Tax=Ailuropoda melanoleuca TaxID=9646 RepID=D2HAQ0_AILME|nr:hypothetical protein PANDA_007533 [Ailuropoda melanoleuca]